MEVLVPSSVMEVSVTLVLTLLGSSIALAKVPSAASHPALLGKSYVGFTNGITVIIVIGGLGQEKQILVIRSGTRLHRARHCVGLMPNYVRS